MIATSENSGEIRNTVAKHIYTFWKHALSHSVHTPSHQYLPPSSDLIRIQHTAHLEARSNAFKAQADRGVFCGEGGM